MNKTFSYLYTTTAMGSVDVEEVGNVLIHLFNDNGLEWFLYIETILGESIIKSFGPFYISTENYFPYGFTYTMSKIDYNDNKLSKIIDNYINDPKKKITQVIVEKDIEILYNKVKKINLIEMR